MKYLAFFIANLLRRKVRTFMTIGSFAVAAFLFAMIVVINGSFRHGLDTAVTTRLVVANRFSTMQPLPLSYLDRIEQIDGVKGVTFISWFGGVYVDERNFFAQIAIDGDTFHSVYPDVEIASDQWQAFTADRQGCVAGATLAKRFKWKLGDRIPIRGTIFPGTWEFNVRAIYDSPRADKDTSQLWFHWKYLDERREWSKGLVDFYLVRLGDPNEAAAVSRSIDATFANSPWETKTGTEKMFATAWLAAIGDITTLALTVSAMVLFTLLLVAGNTMSISLRERIWELGILKSMGYSDARLFAFLMVESSLIAAVGGALGLAFAKVFTRGGDPTGGLLPHFYLSATTIMLGLVLAVSVGVVSALVPALCAMRLKIVDAIRRV